MTEVTRSPSLRAMMRKAVMLDVALPAGFIAPCLPTKADTLPSGEDLPTVIGQSIRERLVKEIAPRVAERRSFGTSSSLPGAGSWVRSRWPAAGSEDTELGVKMEPEVGHGETEIYPQVQA
jgi:hypothetical protein